jgi:hypothetical protein
MKMLPKSLIGSVLALPLLTGLAFAGDSFWLQSPGSGTLSNGTISGTYQAVQSSSAPYTKVSSPCATGKVCNAYAGVYVNGQWAKASVTSAKVGYSVGARATQTVGRPATIWEGRIQSR